MSLRKGLKVIAGSGQTPSINKSTGTWHIGGIDTGVRADYSPIRYDNVTVQSDNDWEWILSDNGEYYTSSLELKGVTLASKIDINISTSLSNDECVEMYKELKRMEIVSVLPENNKITIISIDKPTMDLKLDILVSI